LASFGAGSRSDKLAGPGEPALFTSRRRTRLSIRSVERLFEKLRAATGSKKHVTPHTARHTAATLALLGVSDVSDVGGLLRHADLNTTRRYLHLIDTRRRQVVRILSAAIPAELTTAPAAGQASAEGGPAATG
jgi:site-specific recombinase XerD